jgi:hypothetical protein
MQGFRKGVKVKKAISVFLIIGLFSLLSAQYQVYNQSSSERSKFGIYAAEFGGALLGTLVGGGCAIGCRYLIFNALYQETGNLWIDFGNALGSGAVANLVGGAILVGTPFLSAYGVKKVGEKLDQDGNSSLSAIGGYCGMIIGGGTSYLIAKNIDNEEKKSYIILSSALLGNAIGSVIGYNLNRNSSDDFGYNNTRFGLPSIGLRPEKTDDGKTITAVDFKLINARF